MRLLIKSYRSIIIFMIATGCGLLAVHAGRQWMDIELSTERARLKPPVVNMTEVIVAANDIDAGSEISDQSMAVRQFPSDLVPSQALRPDQFESYKGFRIAQSMRAGDLLIPANALGSDAQTFSHRLREGARALTLQADEINSIAGMLQPGDRIDLYFTAKKPQSEFLPGLDLETTSALFPNLLVLATGRIARPGGGDEASGRQSTAHGTVTLEVDDAQAQRLIVAQSAGRLTAVLRNPDDRSAREPASGASIPMDVRHLFGSVVDANPVVTVKRAIRRSASGVQLLIGGMGSSGLARKMESVDSSAVLQADMQQDGAK